jgi:hypothetical protein
MQKLASKDETRYVLCGVHFEVSENHVMLVATDGRRLGSFMADASGIECPAPQAFTVDCNVIRQLKPQANDLLRVEFVEDRIRFTGGSKVSLEVDAIKGNYPNWKQVTPSSGYEASQIAINIDLLFGFRETTKLLFHGRGAELVLRTHGVDGPISIFASGSYSFYGLLMPLRGKWEPQIPDFAKLTAKAVAPADDKKPEPTK